MSSPSGRISTRLPLPVSPRGTRRSLSEELWAADQHNLRSAASALMEVLAGLWNKNPSDSIPAPEIERIRRTSDCQVPAPSCLHRHGLGFLHSVLTSLSCRRHSCVAAVMRYLCLPPAVASSIQTTRLVRMLGFSNLRCRGLSALDC
jgi:hypothetical protein